MLPFCSLSDHRRANSETHRYNKRSPCHSPACLGSTGPSPTGWHFRVTTTRRGLGRCTTAACAIFSSRAGAEGISLNQKRILV